VKPQNKEMPRDWQNVFVIMGLQYIRVLFHIFYYYWAEQHGSLYWGSSLQRGSLYRVPL